MQASILQWYISSWIKGRFSCPFLLRKFFSGPYLFLWDKSGSICHMVSLS